MYLNDKNNIILQYYSLGSMLEEVIKEKKSFSFNKKTFAWKGLIFLNINLHHEISEFWPVKLEFHCFRVVQKPYKQMI